MKNRAGSIRITIGVALALGGYAALAFQPKNADDAFVIPCIMTMLAGIAVWFTGQIARVNAQQRAAPPSGATLEYKRGKLIASSRWQPVTTMTAGELEAYYINIRIKARAVPSSAELVNLS